MEFRIKTPLQRALGQKLSEMEFLTCAVCGNTTVFSFPVEVELHGDIVNGDALINSEIAVIKNAVDNAQWRMKPDSLFYPRPATIAGGLVRCGKCSHPVWHQQDIIAYHRLMLCSGCEICMLDEREKLIEFCGSCRERNVDPDCIRCPHGESRDYHQLDVFSV